MAHIDPKLYEYATPRQRVILESLEQTGSGASTAAAMGVHRSLPLRTLKAVQAKAAKQGHSPDHDMTHTAPDGFAVKGVSTYYDRDGKVRGQWVKTKTDDVAREAALREAYAAMAEELPRALPVAAPQPEPSKLLNLFTLTDCHVGMLAWHKEGGADWDLQIAEDTLVACFAGMIHRAPRAKVAIVNQLGDFLHFDGLEAMTPTNRHLLDADGRFPKITRVAVRILRRVIDMALETHERVHVVCAEGNHDIASSDWLTIALTIAYENEPRITIDDSPAPFYSYRFGQTLLGFHHGHTVHGERLPMLFAQSNRRAFGQTDHTVIHTGHRHHISDKDEMGVQIVQHATLAARDAYASRHGYLAARQARVITYHEQFGWWGTAVITPEMVG